MKEILIGNCEIKIKKNTIKLPGMKIIRVPEDKMCLISNFHFSYDKVLQYGELSFIEKKGDYILDIFRCKFE